jgi:hypothetical protein
MHLERLRVLRREEYAPFFLKILKNSKCQDNEICYVDRGIVPRINGWQEKAVATWNPRYEKKLSNISYAFHNFMTLSFARSSGSILALCSGLAKLKCGGVLVINISHVYHQHFMHFHISCVPFNVNLLYTNEFHKFWWICEKRSTQKKMEHIWAQWPAVQPHHGRPATHLAQMPRHWSKRQQTQCTTILAVSLMSVWSTDIERPHLGLKGPPACALQQFSPEILAHRLGDVIRDAHEKVGARCHPCLADRPNGSRPATSWLGSHPTFTCMLRQAS